MLLASAFKYMQSAASIYSAGCIHTASKALSCHLNITQYIIMFLYHIVFKFYEI